MDDRTRRAQMEKLWMETFKDSSEYVMLVFDNYYDPILSASREKEGEIVSALLGVPYDFVDPSGNRLRGLYLCGLATKESEQGKGLMSEMLEEINGKAQEKGFDFTFLIPSNDGIRRFYRDRGYHDTFYYKEDFFVKSHRFKKDPKLKIGNSGKEDRETLIEYLSKSKTVYGWELIHTLKDWKAVIDEAEISVEPIIVARSEKGVRGVAFLSALYSEKEERERSERSEERYVRVKKLLADDDSIRESLLSTVLSLHPECGVKVIVDSTVKPEGETERQVWEPFYAHSNGKDAEYEEVSQVEFPFSGKELLKSKGMIRIFDIRSIVRQSGMTDEKALDGFTNEELSELLLRPSVGGKDELERVLHLPELTFSMSLLLE